VKYLLDTDHISALQRRSGPLFEALAARMRLYATSEFVLSIVSFHEQALGAHTFIGQARTTHDVVRGYMLFSEIVRGFQGAPVLPFDATAASTLDQLQSRGIRGGTMDLRIAATALSLGLTLLTRNRRDFESVPHLKIENWLDA
jgi:tRNA(fMet)-specific endonuclease VapC